MGHAACTKSQCLYKGALLIVSWLHVSFLGNYLQASIYYFVAHLVCAYIMVTQIVYIKTYQFKILISSLNSSDRMYSVIHKSLRDFRTRLRNIQDRHGRKEHINR